MAWALLRDDGHRIVAADLPGHGCWTHFFCLHVLQTNHQQLAKVLRQMSKQTLHNQNDGANRSCKI